ncbi:MAG: hypothetical protein ACKOOL_02280 [Novosphingobium sp.]
MNPVKAIKRIIQACAALLLLAMFGYPIAAMWAEKHPDGGAAFEVAAGLVDPEADRMTQAGQFVSNIDKGRREIAEREREKAADKAIEQERRKQEELRRFNTGDDY